MLICQVIKISPPHNFKRTVTDTSAPPSRLPSFRFPAVLLVPSEVASARPHRAKYETPLAAVCSCVARSSRLRNDKGRRGQKAPRKHLAFSRKKRLNKGKSHAAPFSMAKCRVPPRHISIAARALFGGGARPRSAQKENRLRGPPSPRPRRVPAEPSALCHAVRLVAPLAGAQHSKVPSDTLTLPPKIPAVGLAFGVFRGSPAPKKRFSSVSASANGLSVKPAIGTLNPAKRGGLRASSARMGHSEKEPSRPRT